MSLFQAVMFKLLLVVLCLSYSQGARNITYSVNPDCPEDKCNTSSPLIHVQAEGSENNLHHIWDLTFKPCLFFALTSKDTKLKINWNDFLWDAKDGSVKFSKKPLYAFSILFDELIEFNDENKTGIYDPNNNATDYKVVRPMNFSWKIKPVEVEGKSVSVVLTTDEAGWEDKIELTLTAYGEKGHGDILPHLLHTGNATQVDFVFNGLETHFKVPRFVLKFHTVSTSANHTMYIVKSTSLHDEHSPGIFGQTEVMTPVDAEDRRKEAFMQWKNVAYTAPDRSMTNSTNVCDYRLENTTTPYDTMFGTFTRAYFGEQLFSLAVKHMHVSFGSTGDDPYTKNRYLSWTLTAGIGRPGEERFSTMAVIFLCLVFIGFPFLFITFSGLYYLSRKMLHVSNDLLIG